MIEHLDGREKALESLGWSGPEAEWIALVCLHSGIFTRAQFCDYFDARANRAHRFVQALLDRGEAVEPPTPTFPGGAKSCRIFSKRIYQALGVENIRHRREASVNVLMRRLLSLDYVLECPELDWLPTEPEKVRCFEALGLERRMFPHRVYKGSVGKQKRYFALKLPIAVDSETATFAYVDPGNETDSGFRSWGITHGRLWGALREKGIRVRVVTIATEYQPLIRFEGVLRAWTSRASRKQGGKMTVKEEIELLNKAIVDGDDDVLASYGGSTAALRYCVELEELPAAKVGDGVKIDDYTTFRASRFAGLENGNQGGAERGREKA